MKEVGVRIKVGADGLENVGKLSRELEAAGVEAAAFDAKAEALGAELARLGREQTLIDQFRRTKTEVAAAGAAMQGAKDKAQQLGRELAATEAPTRRQAAAFEKARTEARAADAAYQAQRLQLQGLRTQLGAAGIATDHLADAQRRVIQQTAAVRDNIGTLNTQLRSQVEAYRAQGSAAAAAATQQQTAARTTSQSLAQIGTQLQTLQRLAGLAIGGTIFTGLIRGVGETADAYKNLQARIRLVTGEGAAFEQAFDQVLQIATRTNTGLEETGTLFARIARAGKDLDISQREALSLTETINQAFQLSGGSAESQNAAVTQLIQGLQSGVLRGEEFNSISEQGARVTQALAEGLGVTNGELRELAINGKLTTDVVLGALRDQGATVSAEFAKLPPTIGRSIQNLSTAWTGYVGAADAGSGASASAAVAIDLLARNLAELIDLAADAGQAFLAYKALRIAQEFIGIGQATRAATVATVAQTVATRAQAVAAGQASAAQAGLRTQLAASTVAAGGFAQRAAALLGTLKLFAFAAVIANIRDIGTAVGETVARLAGADDGLRKATEAAQLRAAGIAADARGQAENFAEFSRQALLSAEQVARLGEAERADYRSRLEGRQEFERLSLRAALNEQDAGRDTAAVQEQLRQSVGETRAAMDLLQLSQDELAKASSADLSFAARTLVVDFDKLRESGKTVAESLDEVGKALDVGNAQGIRDATEALQQLASDGKASAEQVAAALGAALNGQDLTRFENQARAAFGGAAGEAQLLGLAIDAAIGEAVRRTGVDLDELKTGISGAARGAIGDFDLLIDSSERLRSSGVDVGRALAASLDKALEAATTEQAVELLRERLQDAGEQGLLSGEQVADGLALAAERAAELTQRLEDAKPGIQSLGEAARAAGVDLGELTSGISEDFGDAVQQLGDLATEIDRAGISAQRASPILAQALDQRIAAARTTEEVALLEQQVRRLIDSGQLLGRAGPEALAKLELQATQASPAFQQLQRDAESLGVKIDLAVNQGVDGALGAYERLKASGKFAAGDLQAAFISAALKIIEANNGIVPEFIKVEAAARNVAIAVDDTGRVIVRAFSEGERAVTAYSSSFSSVSDAIRRAKGELDVFTAAARKARDASDLSAFDKKSFDKDGFLSDGNGNRKTFSSGGEKREGFRFDQAAYDRDYNAFLRTIGTGGTNFDPPDPNRFYVPIADAESAASPRSSSPPRPARQETPTPPAPVAPPATRPPGAGFTVTFKTQSGGSIPAEFGSQQAAEQLLRELQTVASRMPAA